MIGRDAGKKAGKTWAALIGDAAGVTVFAMRASAAGPVRSGWRRIEWDLDVLENGGGLADLDRFVREHQLVHCPAQLAFVGAGTVMQKLKLPPLSAGKRVAAVQTRLTQYAGGRPLFIDIRFDGGAANAAETHAPWLAAGVEQRLARGAYRACRKSGLRVVRATALAAALQPPAADEAVVQLVLTERTAAIHLFERGRLIVCRDVPVGRRDFVAAYRRPILTRTGPLTLPPEEAETLLRECGVPVGREEQVRPGFSTTQLWPLLNPVLQKLRNEVEGTLLHHPALAGTGLALHVVSLPGVPGLGEYLAAELQLQGPLLAAEPAETWGLRELGRIPAPGREIDLRPPEEKFVARLFKPALAACACALWVILANSAAPREAGAQLACLRPAVETLQNQLEEVRQKHVEAQNACTRLLADLRQRVRLRKLAPPLIPATGVFKMLFDSVPPGVELGETQFRAEQMPATVEVRAKYQGAIPASLVADRWARELAGSVFFEDAKVGSVSGSGRNEPARIELQAILR